MSNDLSYLYKNILPSLGLRDLPADKQEQMLLKIGDIIFKRILIRAIDSMSEPAKAEYEKLLKTKSADAGAALDFFRAKLPNFDQLVAEEVASFKKEAAEIMVQVKSSVS
ncbi:MAG: hypothetical protein HZC26_04200 [Candidatus Magasanikbacteria bacterium]|nr:hypothetical protein [Candidatus Magasanikbacteria bacterium]